MEGNKLFESLIKITNSKSKINDNEILRESKSLNFFEIKSVSKKNLPRLVKDLKGLVERLDDALVNLYRHGAGPDLQKDYEEFIRQLRLKQARLVYLSSFFESTVQKIEAAKKLVDEHDKKLKDAERRKRKIEDNKRNIRNRLQRRPFTPPLQRSVFPTPNPFRFAVDRTRASSSWTRRSNFPKRLTVAQNSRNRSHVELHLHPVNPIHQDQLRGSLIDNSTTSPIHNDEEDFFDDEDWIDEEEFEDELDEIE